MSPRLTIAAAAQRDQDAILAMAFAVTTKTGTTTC